MLDVLNPWFFIVVNDSDSLVFHLVIRQNILRTKLDSPNHWILYCMTQSIRTRYVFMNIETNNFFLCNLTNFYSKSSLYNIDSILRISIFSLSLNNLKRWNWFILEQNALTIYSNSLNMYWMDIVIFIIVLLVIDRYLFYV